MTSVDAAIPRAMRRFISSSRPTRARRGFTATPVTAGLLALCALASVLLTACASSQPAAPPRGADDMYLGRWTTDGGVAVTITTDAAHENYLVTSSRAADVTNSEGRIIDVDGTPVAMVKVFDPTRQQRDQGAVPLYSFGILRIQGDMIVHTPLRAEWLRQTLTRQSGTTTYIDSSSVQAGTGVGIVQSWDDMESILRSAIRSKDALGPVEVFHRVN